MKTTTNILFNWDGDMNAFFEEFGFRFTTVPEMTDGTYLCVFADADDFDVYDEWMAANGTIEVISGFSNKGKQYDAKKEKNKYKKSKYKKYLRPILNEEGVDISTIKVEVITIDEFGVETTSMEYPPDVWQVNRYAGDSARDLEEEVV